MYLFLESLLENLNKYQSVLSLIIIMAGWLVLFRSGLKQQRKALENKAKMKVYEDLSASQTRLDNALLDGLLLFLKNKTESVFTDIEISTGTTVGKQPINHWLEYESELAVKINEYAKEYSVFLNQINKWINIMPELKSSRNIIDNDLYKLNEKACRYHKLLWNTGIRHKYRQKNTKVRIIEMSEDLEKEIMITSGYLDSFVSLIYNKTIFQIFGSKRKIREAKHFESQSTCKTPDAIEKLRKRHTPVFVKIGEEAQG
jgi:hypothetical protein